jgi:hypothetical protein
MWDTPLDDAGLKMDLEIGLSDPFGNLPKNLVS